MKAKTIEIDSNAKLKLELLDRYSHNIIGKETSLFTDITLYQNLIDPTRQFRTREHIIAMPLHGTMTVHLQGETHELHRNSLMIVPSGTVFSFGNETGEFNLMAIMFSTPEIDPYSPNGYRITHLELAEKELTTFGKYFQLLEELLRIGAEQKSITHLLLSMLSKTEESTRKATRMNGHRHTNRQTRIRESFISLLKGMEFPAQNVGYYAEKLAVSTNYLNLILKRGTGMTAMSWINKQTLRRAQTLLAEKPNMTLEAIAAKFGYSSASSFSKFFKRQTGETPRNHRHGRA